MTISEQILNAIENLPPQQRQQVLEFARALQERIDDEERALGEMGAKLTTEILEPEDFSDWVNTDNDRP